MIEEIIADTGSAKREIVVCTTEDIDNPMPDVVKFVRDKALSEASLHPRAASAGAATIIALRHDDSDTFTAAMAAAAANQQAHVVAYFEQQPFASRLTAHCPRAEALVSLFTEMMVRAALDPGTLHVNRDLMSVAGGQNHFGLTVPADATDIRYGDLLSVLKVHHNATLIAMADSSTGKGLRPNASKDAGQARCRALLHCSAAHRCDASALATGGRQLDHHHLEIRLGGGAMRAGPGVRHVFPLGARRNPLVRDAFSLVIDKPAQDAHPFLVVHCFTFVFCLTHCGPCRCDTRHAPEHSARHHAGARRVVAHEEPADPLARCIKSGNAASGHVLCLRGGGADFKPAAGKGDAAAAGRCLDGGSPIGRA